jgi:ATP-dependent protease ClpP protease subunit/uncharacterized Zn finger protein (UPF0148 family)
VKITNKKSWYSMKKSGDSAEIMLYNDIGFFGTTAEQFVNELDALGDIKNITLRINSYGGEVFDGLAIYNRLKQHSATVKVIIDGIAASMASVIALSGDRVEIAKNAFLMIHDPKIMIAGTSIELKSAAALLDEIKEKVVQIYKSKAKLSDEDLSEMMSNETWIDADSAVENGFADFIIDATENDEPATNKGLSLPEDLKKIFLSLTNLTGGKTPIMKGTIMKCKHCGKDIVDGSVFCCHCGKAVSSTPVDPVLEAARKRELEEARMTERQRVTDIVAACKKHGLPEDFQKSLIDSKNDYNLCAIEILNKLAEKVAPVAATVVTVTKDEHEKFVSHVSNCLAIAGGIEKKPEVIAEAKKDVFVNSFHAAMRMDLEKHGERHGHLNTTDLVTKSLQMIGTGSSDLPAAFENVANKSLQAGYTGAPTTYQQWVGRREVADFKTNSIVNVSNFADLLDLPEGANFADSKIADKKETYSIDTKGRKFTVSRQALINDDLDVLSRIPGNMGRAAARRVNKDVYDQLTYNSLVGPALSDGVALFNLASHYNAIATSGTVTVTTIAAAQRKLKEMPLIVPEPGAAAQYANIMGKYLVTGTKNEVLIRQTLGSGMDISQTLAGVINPYANSIVPIFDPYLQALLDTASAANGWYLAADASDAETIGVAYLRGYTTPTLRRDVSRVGEALGIVMDIYFDYGIYVADHRGIVSNDGASGT